MLKKCQKSHVLPMKNVSVCKFKTSPCVPAPRPHVVKREDETRQEKIERREERRQEERMSKTREETGRQRREKMKEKRRDRMKKKREDERGNKER